MSDKKKQMKISCNVPAELHAAVHELHARTKVPVAIYIREGLEYVVAKRKSDAPFGGYTNEKGDFEPAKPGPDSAGG